MRPLGDTPVPRAKSAHDSPIELGNTLAAGSSPNRADVALAQTMATGTGGLAAGSVAHDRTLAPEQSASHAATAPVIVRAGRAGQDSALPLAANDPLAATATALSFSIGSAPTQNTQQNTAPTDGNSFSLAISEQVGRYVIRRRLGEGGMGMVFVAHDPELEREVALKVIRRQQDADADARLIREAQTTAKLVHPNVVGVHDVGRHDGRAFIAMELVEGEALSVWLESPRPWREVVRVFAAAARGLVAAHAEGLIHRDFKPANVFLGRDGRVKVGDFGLARPEARSGASVRDAAITDLTVTGALVGTPGYMAPEQLSGEPATAKSDQFALAVSLYEGLYGERPFPGATLGALIDAVSSEAVRAPKAGRDVPAWLRAAVLRGLRSDPTLRYPSVAALLAAIERDPARTRRRVAATALALVAAGGTGIAAHSRLANDDCGGIEGELAQVWNAKQRDAITAAFRASPSPFTEVMLTRALEGLDRRAHSWIDMKQHSCKATRRAEQTQAHAGLREVCFAERRIELEATIAAFVHADADVVRRAPDVLDGLADLAACADLRSLSEKVPQPASPSTRVMVDAIKRRLADANAAGKAGKYQRAYELTLEEVHLADPLDYPPITAHALAQAGQLASRLDKPADAERLLTDASLAADAGRDDLTRAMALDELGLVIGRQGGRIDEGLQVMRRGETAAHRAGDAPAQIATRMRYRALLLQQQGKLDEARQGLEAAYATFKEHTPDDAIAIAAAALDLGFVLTDLGDSKRGRMLIEEALVLRERVFGNQHPAYAETLVKIGQAHAGSGDYKAAEPIFLRAISLLETTLGPEHTEVEIALTHLGKLQIDQGRIDEARATFSRAVAIREHASSAPTEQAVDDHYLLGVTLERGGDHAGARREIERALEIARAGHLEDGERALLALQELGVVATSQHRWDEARTAFERVLAVDIKRFGPEHSRVSSDYAFLGGLAIAQGHWDEARAAYERALAIDEKLLGPNDPGVAAELSGLSAIASQQRRYADALALAERELQISEHVVGPDAPTLLYALNDVASALAGLHRDREAAAAFDRGLALPGVDGLGDDVREIELSAASVHVRVGNRARARELAARAAAGSNDPTIIARAKKLAVQLR